MWTLGPSTGPSAVPSGGGTLTPGTGPLWWRRCRSWDIGLTYGADGLQHMELNGEDVNGGDPSLPEISRYASVVSAYPEVRAYLLEMQRRLAREHSVIMDGRDIGTVVLPDAEVKVFLTASAEERAPAQDAGTAAAGGLRSPTRTSSAPFRSGTGTTLTGPPRPCGRRRTTGCAAGYHGSWSFTQSEEAPAADHPGKGWAMNEEKKEVQERRRPLNGFFRIRLLSGDFGGEHPPPGHRHRAGESAGARRPAVSQPQQQLGSGAGRL